MRAGQLSLFVEFEQGKLGNPEESPLLCGERLLARYGEAQLPERLLDSLASKDEKEVAVFGAEGGGQGLQFAGTRELGDRGRDWILDLHPREPLGPRGDRHGLKLVEGRTRVAGAPLGEDSGDLAA